MCSMQDPAQPAAVARERQGWLDMYTGCTIVKATCVLGAQMATPAAVAANYRCYNAGKWTVNPYI
jgi:hypothetical protein